MKTKGLFIMLCVPVSALLVCGCAALSGAPPQTPSASDQRKLIAKEINIDLVQSNYDVALKNGDEQSEIDIRNDFITKTLFVYNSNFNEWTTSTAFEQNGWDTITKVAVLGVDAAGTLTGAAGSKAILAAISGGITGSTELVDKNFFYSKTMPALVSAMKAAREKDLSPIKTGLGETPEQYSLGTAMDDLDTYFYDGTFLGALDYINKTSGSSADSSKSTNSVLSTTQPERLQSNIKKSTVNKLLLMNNLTPTQQQQLQQYQQELNTK